jgi:hypothetical protein
MSTDKINDLTALYLIKSSLLNLVEQPYSCQLKLVSFTRLKLRFAGSILASFSRELTNFNV